MKRTVVMIMAGIMAVALMACGKDADASDQSSSDQSSSEQSADEAPESLNEEINAMVEEEQKQAEEEDLLAILDYPEGFLPLGEYWCYEIQDIYKNDDHQSPLYHTPIMFEITLDGDKYLRYEYDAETKQYTIWRTYSPYGGMSNATDWDHKFVGYLDEESNLIVTHYERTNYKYSGDWQEIVLDDIEWVYVRDKSIDAILVEKQYIEADRALCNKIRSAVTTPMMDPAINYNADPATVQAIADLDNEQDIYSLLSGSDEFTEMVRRLLGVTSADELTLRSHNASGVLPVSAIRIMRVPDSNQIIVWIEGSDASGLQGADPEAMINISVGDYR